MILDLFDSRRTRAHRRAQRDRRDDYIRAECAGDRAAMARIFCEAIFADVAHEPFVIGLGDMRKIYESGFGARMADNLAAAYNPLEAP